MVGCTFFGHRMILENITEELCAAVEKMINEFGVDCFYVGCNGRFDEIALRVLDKVAEKYRVKHYIVLSSLDEVKRIKGDFQNITLLPDGFEYYPPKYAIDRRNRWMIDNSDYAITYVKNEISSGAAKFKRIAEKKGLTVIELSRK